MTDSTKPTTTAKPEKSTAPTAEKPAAAGAEKSPTPSATEKPDAAKDPAKSYSRGEGQKPVTQRYRSNWDNVFGKKKR